MVAAGYLPSSSTTSEEGDNAFNVVLFFDKLVELPFVDDSDKSGGDDGSSGIESATVLEKTGASATQGGVGECWEVMGSHC